MLFLGFGVLFTAVFLVGGGVITSTHGGYWTANFGIGYVLGLVIAGPWVCRPARASHAADERPALTGGQYLIGALIVGLMFAGFLMFIRSELFTSDSVQHVFMIGMGFCLVQFGPLGFGLLRADGKQPETTDPPSGALR
jgi:hypothetical protein